MSYLEIKDLRVQYKKGKKDRVYAIQGVDLELEKQETLGLVGETGAGKTTLALTVMGLLPGNACVKSGFVRLEGLEILGLNDVTMQSVRGAKMAMIFQNPMSSLNPMLTIEKQIAEGIRLHNVDHKSKAEVAARVEELLTMVGIDPIMKDSYPHELSGGMRQRIGIAIALANEPELLIADEPTSALDVTIQAQVLALMNELKNRLEMSMILITHDFGIVARMCDKVAVMYAGSIVESGTWEDFFLTGKHHPYTDGLLNAIPNMESTERRLKPIPGQVADNTILPEGCVFADRCEHAKELCRCMIPHNVTEGTHSVRCHLFEKEERTDV